MYCEPYGRLIDSLYAYDWDSLNNQWKLVTIRHYLSSEGRYEHLLFLNADRTPERVWDYSYDINGNRNLEISSTWINNTWLVTLKKESEFDINNRKINELRHNLKGNKWIFREYYYYEYNGDQIDKIHYQVKDANGMLYDRDYSVYVYSGDSLVEVIGHDGLTESVKTADRFYYDTETGRVSERVSFIYEEDHNGAGIFMPVRRLLYSYDQYNLLREELFQEMKDVNWVSLQKYIVFYKLDTSGKVEICHNGHTICVSVNALKAHLDHGDKLGSCPDENHGQGDNKSWEGDSVKAPYKIYPNPAREKAVIQIDTSIDPDIYRIELIDNFGKVLKSYDAYLKNEIVIYRGNLKDGYYFIRFTGNKVYSAGIIFR